MTNRSINGTNNSETWTFDSLGRLSTDANKLGTFTNTYVGVTNRLSKIAYPGNASANYVYFPNAQDKRLQQIKNLNSSNAMLSQQDYTYDAEGQIQTWTRNYTSLNPVQRFDFGYDNADQLLTAPLKNASTNALIKQYTYAYDVASNRTSETVATATTTSAPNSVNELTSQSGGTVRTLTYDLNGSLTNGGKTSSSATNASKVYTCEWDAANRLVALNYTGTTNRSELIYDGLSRLAKIVEKTGTTVKSTRKIVWSGNEMSEFRDATDTVTGRVYQQGEFIGTTGYTFMRDHLGSVRELIKTDGKTLGTRLDYDPYGRQTTVSGTAAADFGFTGLFRHSASGLNFATYRAYDPDLGRWLNRDPISELGGLNLYAYVANMPTVAADLLGLIKECAPVSPSWKEFIPVGPKYYLYSKRTAMLDALMLTLNKELPIPLASWINFFKQREHIFELTVMRCRDTCFSGWWTEIQRNDEGYQWRLIKQHTIGPGWGDSEVGPPPSS